MPQKLAKERRFSWPVRVSRPDAGDWQTFEFTAHFLAMSRKELDRIAANEVAIEEVLRAHLVGWESVQDAQGQPLAAAMRMLSVKRSDRADLFARLRVMESAALEALAAKSR